MAAKRGKRRRSGSIVSLRAALWATICYNLDVIEDDGIRDHEIKQRASNALVQASLAYLKVVEVGELEKDVEHLEAMAARPGRAA